jgi:hypothetical protein
VPVRPLAGERDDRACKRLVVIDDEPAQAGQSARALCAALPRGGRHAPHLRPRPATSRRHHRDHGDPARSRASLESRTASRPRSLTIPIALGRRRHAASSNRVYPHCVRADARAIVVAVRMKPYSLDGHSRGGHSMGQLRYGGGHRRRAYPAAHCGGSVWRLGPRHVAPSRSVWWLTRSVLCRTVGRVGDV